VMRWPYARTLAVTGMDVSKTLGLPSYFNQIPVVSGLSKDLTFPPQISASGYTTLYPAMLRARDTTYVITPSLTKIVGRHTLKFGADLRRMLFNFYQNNTVGGTFSFNGYFTSQNALNPGASGNSIADLVLGYPSAGSVGITPFTAAGMRYQGYYANDSFSVTRKLTVDLGLRWDIPGVWTERFDRQVTFDPTMPNPVLAGITLNGAPVRGAYVLVNSPDHPERGLRPEHYKLFAPRIGVAYRLTDRTVLRTGGGIFYMPANIMFSEGPTGNPVNSFTNTMVSSIDSQVTPFNTLSDPFPQGFVPAPGRNPKFQQMLLGGSGSARVRDARYGYTGQWNLTVQHQFPNDLSLEAAYAGSRGVHLPQGGLQYDQISPQYLSMGAQLRDQVPNPFYGLITTGALSQPTVMRGYLLAPFPQYTSKADPGGYVGTSNYQALQLKAEKRFPAGGVVLASYTFSKILTNVETLTSWLDAVSGIQNWYDLKGEKSLSNYDSRQRLTVGYVVDLPVGEGKRFLPGVRGVAGKAISGWGINGVSTFQMGFPLGLTASPNLTGFNTGLRPNVMAGCQKTISGPIQSRLGRYFNTGCFTVPAAYTFGNESRSDPDLRGPGINNFDFALFKRTQLTERVNLTFRVETFNLFNRVQFGMPGRTQTTAAVSTFGVISSQSNNPRLIQLALRLNF